MAENTTSKRGNPLNPHCNCDPCECEPPCICGLELVDEETIAAWDEETNLLKYVTVARYAPQAELVRASQAD